MKKFFLLSFCALALLFSSSGAYAQAGWNIKFGDQDSLEMLHTGIELPSGDFIVAGGKQSGSLPYIMRPYVAGISSSGQVLWEKVMPGHDTSSILGLSRTPAGELVGFTGWQSPGLVKINSSGDPVWFKKWILKPAAAGIFGDAFDIDYCANGDYMVVGNIYQSGANIISLARCDTNGDTLWTRNYNSLVPNGEVYGIEPAGAADEFWIVYRVPNQSNIGLIKVDGSGNVLTSKIFGGYWMNSDIGMSRMGHFRRLPGGDYELLVRYTNMVPNVFNTLLHLDANADTTGRYLYNGTNAAYLTGHSLLRTSDGNFVVLDQNMVHTGPDRGELKKITPAGTVIWSRNHLYQDQYVNEYENVGEQMIPITNGYLIIGYIGSLGGSFTPDAWVVKTNDQGWARTNVISGNYFADANQDCMPNSGDVPVWSGIVRLTPGPEYVFPDSAGYYEFHTDSGTYTVDPLFGLYTYNLVCPGAGSYTTTFPLNNNLVDSLDHFAVEKDTCKFLTVNIGTGNSRLCFGTHYVVDYCNEGFFPVSNVSINVVVDSSLVAIDSASVNYTLSANTVTFPIGTLQPGECGSLDLYGHYICAVAHIGFNSCVNAFINPANTCTINSAASWDGSIIDVVGSCLNDSTIHFNITNLAAPGVGDMSGPRNLIVYEDNLLYNVQPFNLNGGQSTGVNHIRHGGTTITMLAEQDPSYPFGAFAVSSVEGCGTPTFHVGFASQFPQQDANPNHSEDCIVLTAAYDPNDKTVSPLGFGVEGYIDENIDRLFYRVRFQNTGTDTAINITLVDTLSAYLDPSTIRVTGASHPFTYAVEQGNILRVNFHNIMLPDSGTNEMMSHGFVMFNIALQPGLPPGTQITNAADIFFDFNPGVRTSSTLNTITEDVYAVVGVEEIYPQEYAIWPNPFNALLNVKLIGAGEGAYHLELYDLLGRRVLCSTEYHAPVFTVPCALQSDGIYMYTIYSGTKPVSSGKLIYQKQ